MSKIIIEAKAMEEWIKVNIKTIVASFSILLVAYFYGYPVLSFVFDFLLFCKTSIEQFIKSNSSFAGAFFAFLFMVIFDDIKNLRNSLIDELSSLYLMGQKCIIFEELISEDLFYINKVVSKQHELNQSIKYRDINVFPILEADMSLKISGDMSSNIATFNVFLAKTNNSISYYNNVLNGKFISMDNRFSVDKKANIDFFEIEEALGSVKDNIESLQYINDEIQIKIEIKSSTLRDVSVFWGLFKLRIRKISEKEIKDRIMSKMIGREFNLIEKSFDRIKMQTNLIEEIESIGYSSGIDIKEIKEELEIMRIKFEKSKLNIDKKDV